MPLKQIVLDGVGGDANEVAAIVVRMNFYVGRQRVAVELVGFLFHAAQDVLRLLAAAHQDHAFDSVVVVLNFVLEAKNAEARRVADHHVPTSFTRTGTPLLLPTTTSPMSSVDFSRPSPRT